MVHKALKDCIIVTAGTGEHDWSNQDLSKWIKEASGTFDRTLSDSTTHLAITKKLWNAGGPLASDALRRRKHGQKIQIVSQDWLNDSLQERTKKKEKVYRLAVPESHSSSSDGGNGNGKDGGEGGGTAPRSHGGLLKELYLENTELTPVQKRLNEKQQAMEEAMMKERAEEKERELQKHIRAKMAMPELAAIFKKSAQKAKKILLNDCYHIYHDSTSFAYDVTLTKVDTARNTNERYNLVLQIFESNVVPHNYAFSTSFSGTKVLQTDNVVVAIGSNLPTAMRAFRNCFKEKTGIDWADRIKVARERALREKEIKQAKKMGVRVAGPVKALVDDIRIQKFLYYPPSYGPVGETAEHPPQQQQQGSNGFSQDQEHEFMMSGGNGAQSPLPNAEVEEAVHSEFGPEDLEKFVEAQVVQDEDGEKLDPMAAPFDFGEMIFEDGELAAPDAIVEAAEQYEDVAPDLAAEAVGEQSQHEQGPPELEDTVLRKRKDSPITGPEGEAKKQKTDQQQFDPETGEYIIDEETDED